MFSKAVITFLAIGALSVNVSATPIPLGMPKLSNNQKWAGKLPRLFSALPYRGLTFASAVGGSAAALAAAGLTGGVIEYEHNHNHNFGRELASDPDPSYTAVGTLMDNYTRAPSDGPVRSVHARRRDL